MVNPATTSMRKSVAVTITSDLMCPWCFVGLRKLQKAADVADVETKITWKPFMLRPGLPEKGICKERYSCFSSWKSSENGTRVGRH